MKAVTELTQISQDNQQIKIWTWKGVFHFYGEIDSPTRFGDMSLMRKTDLVR